MAATSRPVNPVVFVRHAEPTIDSSLPPSTWTLSEVGHRAAARLGGHLAGLNLVAVVTSDEAKAIGTAQHLANAAGVALGIDRRLHEVERPWVDTGFAELVACYLTGEAIAGWEERDVVVRRVADALGDIDDNGLIAIVTHGTAMTVYLGAVVPIDPVAFWRGLTMPDAWLLDGDTLARVTPG